MKKGTRLGLLCVLLCLGLLVSGCGRAEVSTTILTEPAQASAPIATTEATEVPTTVPVTELDAQPSTEPTTEPADQPTAEPSESSEVQGRDYVLNTNSEKFHFPDCSSVKQIKDSNRQDFHGTREELLAQGYSPCGRCKP